MKTITFLFFFCFICNAQKFKQTIDGLSFVYQSKTLVNIYKTNNWIVITGGYAKTTIIIKNNLTTMTNSYNLVVDCAKSIRIKKSNGIIFSNLFIGTFPANAIGDVSKFRPNDLTGKGIKIKLKNCHIGTIIGANIRFIYVDSIKNMATDDVSLKGIKLKCRGDIGGTTNSRGWIGVPPDFINTTIASNMSANCFIKDIFCKGRFDHMDVYSQDRKCKEIPIRAKGGIGDDVHYHNACNPFPK